MAGDLSVGPSKLYASAQANQSEPSIQCERNKHKSSERGPTCACLSRCKTAPQIGSKRLIIFLPGPRDRPRPRASFSRRAPQIPAHKQEASTMQVV